MFNRIAIGIRLHFCGFLLVIIHIKTGTLEDDAGAAEKLAHVLSALGAFLQGFVLDGLKSLKLVLTLQALVFICRHRIYLDQN